MKVLRKVINLSWTTTYKIIINNELDIFRYGYAANTKIKFVIVLQSSNVTLRDNEVRMVRKNVILNVSKHSLNFKKIIIILLQIFRKLHAAYSNAVCNPFYIPGDQIDSK